ncbi:hypothetical protein Tco_1443696 [Tanacetum coccineum]
MSLDLQRTLEKYNAYDMMKELKTMFEEQAKHELFETIKSFNACKQEKGQSVSSYLLNMKIYLDTLDSLNKDYDHFVQNYNMHSMGKTLAELHAILKLHEKGAKGKGEGKNKLAFDPKPKIPLPPKREHPTKDSICHHCKEGYALEIVARILNMVPTKKVDRAPYKIWHGKSPKLSYLRVWGCEALVKRDTPGKLNSRSIKCYPKEMMGYYFYYSQEKKISVYRNARFFKNSFMVQEASGSHGLLKMSGSDKGLEIIQVEDTQPSKNTSKEHNKFAPIKVEP